MIDICSLWAYEDIKNSDYLGDKQLLVLKLFIEHPEGLTATQVVKILGRGVSENIRNRITELTEQGFLEKVAKVRCPITQKMVNKWKFTGRKKPLDSSVEKVCCPNCDGKGFVFKKIYHIDKEIQQKLF